MTGAQRHSRGGVPPWAGGNPVPDGDMDARQKHSGMTYDEMDARQKHSGMTGAQVAIRPTSPSPIGLSWPDGQTRIDGIVI